MRLLTVEQTQNAELQAQTEYNLSSEVLMEAAGAAVAEAAQGLCKDKRKKILILVGPGNNGADGFVIARLLKRQGFLHVRCQIVKENLTPKKIWSMQKERALNSGVEILHRSADHLKLEISESDLIIDAIFGVGFRGSLPEEISTLVEFINNKKVPVLAVDCPTGLDLHAGLELPVAFRADVTVTFGLAKPGFFVLRGPRCTGELQVRDIGFPFELLKRNSLTHFAWGENASRSVLPIREETAYKGDNGSVYVFAGSNDYPGAGVLVSKAAGRTGAGYVYLISSDIYEQIPLAPEVIFRPREKFKFKDIKKQNQSPSLIVGPGLGTCSETAQLLHQLKRQGFENVVVDADALTVCAQEKLFPLPSTWILTPHAGELAKLLDCTTKALPKDRFVAAETAAKKWGCTVLYKGFRTVVSDGSRSIVILSGNAALGKAGSGDVLSGFIGAFRAQGLTPMAAACLGAYLHGRLADEWLLEGKDVLSLLPSDLVEKIPTLLHQLRQGSRPARFIVRK